MIVKSQHLPKVILKNFEASKMSAYECIDHLVEHIVDTRKTALRRSNPEFGKLSDEIDFGLIRHVVWNLPSNRPR